jgi:pimeloyl-ACP methyl ester carboxylesterase
LLNATPIWGLNLPGWSGHLPAPMIPKIIGRYLFDVMRHTNTIHQFLNETYMNDPIVFHPQFVQQIQSCTNGPGGHAAFASILWSPSLHLELDGGVRNTNYYDCIQNVKCHVLLCYGQNDPWCKPIFAKKMLHRLINENSKNNNDPPNDTMMMMIQPKIYKYIELSNVGHCPNHEAPIATSSILMKWFHQIMSNDNPKQKLTTASNTLLQQDQQEQSNRVMVNESWGTTIVQERSINDISMSWMDQIVIAMI